MKRIAKFHKVSEKRFLEDWKDTFPDAEEEEIPKSEEETEEIA